MTILITGNLGYIGPVVARHLRRRFPDARLLGLDTGFFAGCLTGDHDLPETCLDAQLFQDVRTVGAEVFAGVDAVIHLAAISNDPMGKAFESVTDAINHQASLRLAKLAKGAGVKSFVFASSCSVYGFAESGARTEDSELNPLTAYARSKVDTETGLRELAGPDFRVTCLRFATACGWSPRLRLDLVLNDFVASAIATGEILILSDGTPWRPLIDVADMARALEWGVVRDADAGGDCVIVNAGSDAWNYQIKDLALAVKESMPGVSVSINQDAQPDKRSYKVDFSRFRELAPDHQPAHDLPQTISALKDGLEAMNFSDAKFRESELIRLHLLSRLKESGAVDEELFRVH